MSSPFGVYVHVPFCASRCDYCAFATWTDRDPLMADYADACAAELQQCLDSRPVVGPRLQLQGLVQYWQRVLLLAEAVINGAHGGK